MEDFKKREHRSFGEHRSNGEHRPSGERRSFGEHKSFNRDRKPFGDRDRKPYGERKPFRSHEGEEGGEGRRTYSKPYGERRSYGDKPAFSGERKSYGEGRRSSGDRKSFGGDHKSFGRKPAFGRKPSFGGPRKKREDGIDRMINRKPIAAKMEAPATVEVIAKDEVRLNKFIANSGVCSRREADTMIQAGVVSVNGVVVTELQRRASSRRKQGLYRNEQAQGLCYNSKRSSRRQDRDGSS